MCLPQMAQGNARLEGFGRIIKYVMANPRRCQFRDVRGHRLIQVKNIPSVAEAVGVLRGMERQE